MSSTPGLYAVLHGHTPATSPAPTSTTSSTSLSQPTVVVDDAVHQRALAIAAIGEECLELAELEVLVKSKPGFRLYDGFEPSGRMHIAQGLIR